MRWRREGGLIRPRVEKPTVGSGNSTSVDGVLKQISIVRDLIGDQVAVHGVLCFVEADWPLLGGYRERSGVQATDGVRDVVVPVSGRGTKTSPES